MDIGTWIEYFSRICRGFSGPAGQIFDGSVILGRQLKNLRNSTILVENQ
jgi:hypothetical protein